ncbi:hypothetical protein Tco_0752809 [Tanacetum coccineum]|uniref:Uncharacterized protein n=1 Tax=Tanacetum coccineum TaxID=301880 RepID=A0ABQ4ZBH2_9ASTR
MTSGTAIEGVEELKRNVMDKGVILFSIHNDEWKSFQCHHQTALRSTVVTATSIPCQMLNLRRTYYLESFKIKGQRLPLTLDLKFEALKIMHKSYEHVGQRHKIALMA